MKNWLLAPVPLLPLVLVIAFNAPPTGEQIVDLRGSWDILDPITLEVAPDTRFHVPGQRALGAPPPIALEGEAGRLVLARVVELPAQLAADETWFFTLGNTRAGVAKVFINDQLIGSEGLGAQDYKYEQAGWTGYEFARELLRPGANRVVVDISFPSYGFPSVLDGRVLLGPSSQLRRWIDANVGLKHFLELGPVFFLPFALALFLVLLFQEKRPEERRRYASVILVCATTFLYVWAKSGFLLASFLSLSSVSRIILSSIPLMGLAFPEFVEEYALGRVTWVRKINRVLSPGLLLAELLSTSFGGPSLYTYYVPYLFLLFVYASALITWSAVTSSRFFAPLLSGAVSSLMIAAVNDLLTDLDLVTTPRLFSLAVGNFGVIATALIVAEFLRITGQNKELTGTLASRNRDLEAALSAAEEGQRVKSEFLANTSHELRTPLNSIINVPEGVLDDFERRPTIECASCNSLFDRDEDFVVTGELPCPECGDKALRETLHWRFEGDADDAVYYLRSVQESGRHLLAVVNDILDFSKIEAGKMDLHVTRTQSVSVAERVQLTLAPLAEERGIELVVDVEETELTADPVKLAQVLMNLVSNALKFSESGQRVVLRGRADDEAVRFSVIDEGIGIAPEHLELIFESFRQVDSGHTRRFAGTGLGLAITQRLVEMHGGTLSVESVLGEGSTFTVELPREAV